MNLRPGDVTEAVLSFVPDTGSHLAAELESLGQNKLFLEIQSQ